MARSSSGGGAICYVLPVLWMTSRLAVVGRIAMRGRLNLWPTTTSGVAILGRSLMSMNALLSIGPENVCSAKSSDNTQKVGMPIYIG